MVPECMISQGNTRTCLRKGGKNKNERLSLSLCRGSLTNSSSSVRSCGRKDTALCVQLLLLW